jgi:hypothetical protein
VQEILGRMFRRFGRGRCGETVNLLVHHAAYVEIGVEVGAALLMPGQNVLQQGPFVFRLILRHELAGIEEQKKNALAGGVDQFAGKVEILRRAGRHEPLGDTATIDVERFGL